MAPWTEVEGNFVRKFTSPYKPIGWSWDTSFLLPVVVVGFINAAVTNLGINPTTGTVIKGLRFAKVVVVIV